MEKISIVVPAWNEEKRIGKTLKTYGKYFDKLVKEKKLDYEILVVINNTQDRTDDVVRRYQKKHKRIKFVRFEQGGKGFAIIEGFKEALKRDFSLIGFVDADMSTYPEAYYDLIENIKGYEGIIGGRWKKGAKADRTLGKLIRSKGFNFLTRSLFYFPYGDTQCGAKIFRKEVIEKILPEIRSVEWAFDVDLLYLCRKNNFKVNEHPTVWEDKEGSNISIKTPIKMAAGVVRLRMVYSPFNFVVRAYDKLPEKIKIHSL